MKLIYKIFFAAFTFIPMSWNLFMHSSDGGNQIKDQIDQNFEEVKKRFLNGEETDSKFELAGIDGPYLIGNNLISVDEHNNVLQRKFEGESIEVIVNNKDVDRFSVQLRKKHKVPAHEYQQPSKLIAISDIEGNFNGFASFLQANKVIDENFQWIYGDGHLVLVGDFVDRGQNVMPTLWLIYNLEAQAEAAGGMVHFILGNHEIMNINGNFDYAVGKFHKIAELLGEHEEPWMNNKVIFSKKSELGRWMRSKNTIEKIGDYLFVHAGLSPEILPMNLSLKRINKSVRANIDNDELYHYPGEDPVANFLMGRLSPFWYRGFVMNYKYYTKITEPELSEILEQYASKAAIIGHTVVSDVSTDFNQKIIRIDVKHGKDKHSGKTKGLLIENGQKWRINDLGQKTTL